MSDFTQENTCMFSSHHLPLLQCLRAGFAQATQLQSLHIIGCKLLGLVGRAIQIHRPDCLAKMVAFFKNKTFSQAENLLNARCWPSVFSKVLAACKTNLITCLCLKKLQHCSHVRKCSQRPFDTPPSLHKCSFFAFRV